MLSKAKEEARSYTYWFRTKYNLSPLDERFLKMTLSDIKKEFIMDRLTENPDFDIKSMERPNTDDDLEWMKQQELEVRQDYLKSIFEGKQQVVKEKVTVERKVKPTGMSPIEAARSKVTSKATKKVDSVTEDKDENFEVLYRETNTQ